MVRWPLQPWQPLQKTQLQPPLGPSVDWLCHPWFTTTNLSYRFPIFETSAAAMCRTTGIYNVELVYSLSEFNYISILMLLYSICGRDVVLLRQTCHKFCFTVASALPCCRAKKVGLKIWTLKGVLKWVRFPWGSMISQSFNVLQTGEWGNPQFFLTLRHPWQEKERRLCFLQFLSGLLQLNPDLRWTPKQAQLNCQMLQGSTMMSTFWRVGNWGQEWHTLQWTNDHTIRSNHW